MNTTEFETRDWIDDEAFGQDYPIAWWLTLVGPFALTVSILYLVWEFAGTNALGRLVGTAFAFFFFGKVIILGGIEGDLLDSHSFFTVEQLVVIVLYMDLMTACVLAFHLGFLFQMPVIGLKLKSLVEDGQFIMQSNPWMKRATFFGLVVFVLFPLPASGSVGGSIIGRLLGMSRLGTFAGIALGNVLGCALLYFFSELIARYVGRDNPWLWMVGIGVIVAIVLLLNHRYRQIKIRNFSSQRSDD